jgi:hypothetical protein
VEEAAKKGGEEGGGEGGERRGAGVRAGRKGEGVGRRGRKGRRGRWRKGGRGGSGRSVPDDGEWWRFRRGWREVEGEESRRGGRKGGREGGREGGRRALCEGCGVRWARREVISLRWVEEALWVRT